jgi:hypothetical protein
MPVSHRGLHLLNYMVRMYWNFVFFRTVILALLKYSSISIYRGWKLQTVILTLWKYSGISTDRSWESRTVILSRERITDRYCQLFDHFLCDTVFRHQWLYRCQCINGYTVANISLFLSSTKISLIYNKNSNIWYLV